MMKLVCLLSVVVLMLGLVGCSDQAQSGQVPYSRMVPPAAAIGEDCEIREDLSDRRAIEIANGTYTEPSDSGDLVGIISVAYRNPSCMVQVERFVDAEAAQAKYDRTLSDWEGTDGLDVESFNGIGAAGFCREGVTGFHGEFRYGNIMVGIVMQSGGKDDLLDVARGFDQHYDSVAE